MKTKHLPFREKPGAHLMQMGLNSWSLIGQEAVSLYRVERGGVSRWVVSMDNRPRGDWSNVALALSHAYALATGHSNI